MATYRASKYVRQGVVDEHVYNLFMDFEEICCRLGLWDESVGWFALASAFHRITGKRIH